MFSRSCRAQCSCGQLPQRSNNRGLGCQSISMAGVIQFVIGVSPRSKTFSHKSFLFERNSLAGSLNDDMLSCWDVSSAKTIKRMFAHSTRPPKVLSRSNSSRGCGFLITNLLLRHTLWPVWAPLVAMVIEGGREWNEIVVCRKTGGVGGFWVG